MSSWEHICHTPNLNTNVIEHNLNLLTLSFQHMQASLTPCEWIQPHKLSGAATSVKTVSVCNLSCSSLIALVNSVLTYNLLLWWCAWQPSATNLMLPAFQWSKKITWCSQKLQHPFCPKFVLVSAPISESTRCSDVLTLQREGAFSGMRFCLGAHHISAPKRCNT